MDRFTYTAMNGKGIEVSGCLDAESTASAADVIREMGYFPTSISQGVKRKPQTNAAGGHRVLSHEIRLLTRRTIRTKVLALFTRQLAALIDAGLPLLKSLRVLESQHKTGPLKEALVGIGESVESGSTFSEALTGYPRVSNKLFVNMVKAGEAGGVMELALNKLAEFFEKSQRLKSRVKSAMIYPAVVLTVALGVVTFLMASVVPRLKEVFDNFAVELPHATRALIRVSTLVRDHLWYNHFLYVGALLLLPFGILMVFNVLKRTDKGKMALDSAKLNFPILGNLLRQIAIARFSRTLGTLITSGVPILQALHIVRDTSGNEVVSRAVGSVHDGIREGESIAVPLRSTRVFNPVVISMIEVGEETGKLPEMLMKIADNCEEDVDNAVAGITSIIEPVLIVLLAVLVGFIAISMFLPLIEAMKRFSGAQ